jgi:hypothetical protein
MQLVTLLLKGLGKQQCNLRGSCVWEEGGAAGDVVVEGTWETTM